MRKTTRRLLLAGLAILLGAAAIGTVSASGPRRPAPLVPAAGSTDLTAAAASAPTAWFVELQDPPAGVAWADAIEAESETGAATSGASARAQAAGQFQLDMNKAAQAVVAPQLSARGAREIYRVSRALNGIAVLATPEQARVASRWKPARRRS
jgi:hypothetical protein